MQQISNKMNSFEEIKIGKNNETHIEISANCTEKKIKMSLKKLLFYTMQIIAYVLFVPVIVILLIYLVTLVYFLFIEDEVSLLGFVGLSVWLTIFYYLFCILFFLIRKTIIRKWLLFAYLVAPTTLIFHNSGYELDITLLFGLSLSAYYMLFLVFRNYFNNNKAVFKSKLIN